MLLLLHGIGSSGTAWGGQVRRLRKDYTCLAPDLPGYGESPDPTASGLDGILAPILDILDGQPAHIVGVSFGALAALAIAHRHPVLARSLVLADATLGRAYESEAALARWLQHRHALANDLASQSRRRAAEIASPGAPDEVVQEIARHMRRARPRGYIEVAETIAVTNAEPWLPEIRQPTLVICGEDDGVTGLALSRSIASKISGARLVEISGAGHAPHIEQPDLFEDAVRKFLAEQAA